MSHKKLKEKVIQHLISRAPVSIKKATTLINNMEDEFLKETGVATEYITTILPDLEKKIQVYENFIGGLQGKYITDKNPATSTLKEIQQDFLHVDLNEFSFKINEIK